MSTDSPADRRFHELVRYAYVEHLLAQRRVLVLGGLTSSTCEHIAELRARFVVGVTDDEDLADELLDGEPPQNIKYQSMSLSALNFRDGSFDVVVVPDLGLLDDPEEALREARRVLTPEGVALISLANREAVGGLAGVEPPEVGYTELFEICSNVWSIVRMVGQSPFVGYAVADFAPEDEEPSISFDASLAPDEGEEVEFYLAICGDEPVEIDPYAIVQMPLAAVVPQEVDGVASGASEAEVDELRESVVREKERAIDQGLRAQRLEHELKAMADEAAKGRDRAARFARELEEEKKARQRAEIEGQMARRSPELAELREKVNVLTADLEAARAAAGERDRERSRAAEQAAWGKEHQRLEGELADLRRELEAVERARLEAEARAKHAREQSQPSLDALRRDLEKKSTHVIERDAQIAALEVELAARPQAAQLDALANKTKALEEQVALLRAAIEEGDAERGRDLGRIEDELRQRVRRIGELDAEVARREAIVRDLCAQLEDSARALPEIAEAARERQADLDAARGAMDTAGERAEIAEGKLAIEVGRVSELGARIAVLEDERQASQWRVDELESRLTAARKGLVEVDVAAAMTRGYRMRIAELEQEVESTIHVDTRPHGDLDRARSRMDELERELADCRTRGEELARNLSECQERGRGLGKDIEARDARVRELEGTMGRLEAYAREVEGELAALRTKASENETAAAAARSEAQDLATHFQASETDASFARHMAAMAQEELLELRSILTIRDAQLAALEGARRGYAVRTRELEVEEGERRTIEADMSGHISQLDSRLDEVQHRLTAAEAARLESQERTEQAEAREREGTAAVHRLMEENEAQRVRLREALERGDVLLAELEARQGEVVDSRRDRQSVEATVTDLRRRLEEVEAEREGLRAEVDGARRVRQDLEFRVEARERELAEVRAAHSSLEGDFRSARGSAEARSQELAEARRASADAERTSIELRVLVDAAHRETEEARAEAQRNDEIIVILKRDLDSEGQVVEELRSELSARGEDVTRASMVASREVDQLRQHIAALETAAEEMASRGATAIADAEERSLAVRQGLEAQMDRLRRELVEARRPTAAEPEVDSILAELARARDELGRVREDLGGGEVMMRSLMAQIEERDGRIALLERHALEEGQRAESTMRGYDGRFQQMTEELMKLRAEHSAAQRELASLRGGDGAVDPRDTDPLGEASRGVEVEVLRATLDAVRRDLSRLSEDPRGQPVVEELRILLRRLRS